MSWLSAHKGDGHLCEAVSRFNEALDVLERGGPDADATRFLSDALRAIQAEWSLLQTTPEPDDVGTFGAMLRQELSSEAQAELLGSHEVANVLGLEPGGVTHDGEARARLLEPLAELVRAHSHPTLIPVQMLLVNLLLDKPDERLVIYGTLAPGRVNHYVIEDLRGRYRDCAVRGRISEVDGLPYFTWAPAADTLGAQLFCSKQLPEKWRDLDRLRG